MKVESKVTAIAAAAVPGLFAGALDFLPAVKSVARR
jgi:hypothetical protein